VVRIPDDVEKDEALAPAMQAIKLWAGMQVNGRTVHSNVKEGFIVISQRI
jgi:hypothetical protein